MVTVSTDKVVAQYLRQKNYVATEAAFAQEAQVDAREFAWRLGIDNEASIANYILFYDAEEDKASRYDESYSRVKDWVDKSLDIYKEELHTILYPLFVHCFLDLVSKSLTEDSKAFFKKYRLEHATLHDADISQLQSVTHPQHIQQNKIAKVFRENKYNVRMSQKAFELLVGYLRDCKFMLLLGIVNQYINVQILERQPADALDDNEPFVAGGMSGVPLVGMSMVNKERVLWGSFPVVERRGDALEGEEDYVAAGGRSTKRVRVAVTDEADRLAAVPPAERVPLVPEEELAGLSSWDDLRLRLPVDASSLPSVCMFTMFNTYDSMSAVSFSADVSLLAAGFDDSVVHLWDLKASKPEGAAPGTKVSQQRTRLVGHMGPVYSVAFTPDNSYLLSCSEDATARLWSLELKTNLAVFKGHNFPIWDLAVSPLGVYFATASHDRTARLWSMDQIYPLRIFAGHLSDVDCVRFHPNSNYIATGSSDKSVRLWDVSTGELVRIFTGHRDSPQALAFSHCGRYLASGGEDKTILLWDIGTGSQVKALRGHRDCVRSLAFTHEGGLLASGSDDATVRLWDVTATAKREAPDGPLKTLYTKSTRVHATAVTRRNLVVAAGPLSMGE